MLWRDLRPPGRTVLPVGDLRHDIVAAWNADGAGATTSARFNPEGRLASQNGEDTCSEIALDDVCPGAGDTPFAFAGAWRSSVTGLVLLGKRWDSPAVGEFLSPDPAGVLDSWNRYAYGRFDPVTRWDPEGLDSRPVDETETPRRLCGRMPATPDVRHPGGRTERFQIIFYTYKGDRMQRCSTPSPVSQATPATQNPAFCTCQDAIQFCTGRSIRTFFPGSRQPGQGEPSGLAEASTSGLRGLGALRGLGGLGRGLKAGETRPAAVGPCPSVPIPTLSAADKAGPLLKESMEHVQQVKGFGPRAQTIRGLYSQISAKVTGWYFKEAPGLDGSRIFFGSTNATILRPDGAVFIANDIVNPASERLIKGRIYFPPYDKLQLVSRPYKRSRTWCATSETVRSAASLKVSLMTERTRRLSARRVLLQRKRAPGMGDETLWRTRRAQCNDRGSRSKGAAQRHRPTAPGSAGALPRPPRAPVACGQHRRRPEAIPGTGAVELL